jgi:hypothetical protein
MASLLGRRELAILKIGGRIILMDIVVFALDGCTSNLEHPQCSPENSLTPGKKNKK